MQERIASLLELTDRVQAALDSGEWLRAGELEAERRGLLVSLVATARSEGRSAELAPLLGDFLERANHVVGEIHHHQRRLLREASMLRTGHAAASAYGDNRAD